MLPTQSASARHFAKFDLSRVPSPCFVVDEVALRDNLAILQNLSVASGAKILLSLKAFSMWSLAELVNDCLHGCSAASLWEARLAHRYYGGLLASYAPAFKPSELTEIAHLSDHIIFNNTRQIAAFAATTPKPDCDIGLRLNPEHSESDNPLYDPSAADSRLGQPISQLQDTLPPEVRGLHLHNLCEQGFAPLQRTMAAVAPYLAAQSGKFDWLNLGGGHLLTHPDYDRPALVSLLRVLAEQHHAQLYLEPGMAVAFDAGILVGEVLDVAENNAILDISATCHMPDVLEAPYRPALLGEAQNGMNIRLGGVSCLAGDVIGAYQFARPPKIGQRVAFLDQAHYSMVKSTSFNGVA
ncbi:MAG: carboxynorspermidine decarboxylase, partial [Parvibaculales bacterium]